VRYRRYALTTGDRFGIASILVGTISAIMMLCYWLPIPDLLLAVLAIIFGVVSISAANTRAGANKAPASGGITFGVVVVVVILLLR
jgi:hypothetical protein